MALSAQGTSVPSPFIFHFGSQTVRAFDLNGEIWFVAADIATALEYRSAPDLTRILDEDERGTQIVRTPFGTQQMTVLNESGLYSAILRSRKPEAKRFRKWVTAEVLPTIRKTGQYSPAQSPRITREQYRQLADLVYRWGCCFAYSNSAQHAAWQLARSICGTRATDMPAQAFPAVLAASKATHKQVDQFLTKRQIFEKDAIRQVFGHNTHILPQPNFPQLPPDPFLAR